MRKLYPTMGVGDLKTYPAKAFELCEKEPLVILQHTKAKAIMVSPDQWNAMAERLERLEAIETARRVEAITNAGSAWVPWEETKAKAKARAL